MTGDEASPFCCGQPSFGCDVNIGHDAHHGGMIRLSSCVCNHCGAVYMPDDQDGRRCPLINYDSSGALLRVRWVRALVQ